MFKLLFLTSFFLAFCSCSKNHSCITFGSGTKKEVLFYTRYGVGLNNVYTHQDYVVITNYENKTMLVSDFIKLAKQYIDTARQNDTLIGSVIFLRQNPYGCTPEPTTRYVSNSNKIDKIGIIEVGFESRNPGLDNNTRIEKAKDLRLVNIWKNGQAGEFIYFNDSTKKNLLFSNHYIDN